MTKRLFFRDVGTLRATLEAAAAADFYGCPPGHALEIADGEQAYVQADEGHAYVVVPASPSEADLVEGEFSSHEEAGLQVTPSVVWSPDAGTY